MINKQPITKALIDPEGLLEVHHLFSTIQGEGPFAGVPAIFIRLFGCNLQCPACDTDYTSIYRLMMPRDIVKAVEECKVGGETLIVFSGGEPFRQNITPAAAALIEAGYRVQVETNGTLPPPPGFDALVLTGKAMVVCSPKTGSVNALTQVLVEAYKYVVDAFKVCGDGLPESALNHPAKPVLFRPPKTYSGRIYVQPLDAADEVENQTHLEAAIRSSRQHGFTLCLQTHKLINLE